MNIFDIGNDQTQGDRDYQQDKFTTVTLENGAFLAILADGMGGYKGGEIASKVVSDTFRKEFKLIGTIEESLKETLLKANHNLQLKKDENQELNQMGTTLIVLYFNKESFRWISVGDSPLYILRDNTISRENKNHSISGLLELQYKKGEISKNELENNPNKHMLTSAITGEEIPQIDISKEYKFIDGVTIILASDGIETLSMQDVLNIVNSSDSNQKACEAIIKKIEKIDKKNQDNATLIIVSKNKPNSKIDIMKPKSYKRLLDKIVFIFLSTVFLYLLVILVKNIDFSFSDTNATEANNTKNKPVVIVKKTEKKSSETKEINRGGDIKTKTPLKEKKDINLSNKGGDNKISSTTKVINGKQGENNDSNSK